MPKKSLNDTAKTKNPCYNSSKKGLAFAEFPGIYFEGPLTIHLKGNKANRALMLDGDGSLSYGPAAKLYEGDAAPGIMVKELTLTKGLTKESKRFVKILVSE